MSVRAEKMVLDPRVADWAKCKWGVCCAVDGCEELPKHTVAGEYCLAHYLELETCSVPGCHNPVWTNGAAKHFGKCRRHLYEESDNEELEEMRRNWRSRSSLFGAERWRP
jgi:hypothetical protein